MNNLSGTLGKAVGLSIGTGVMWFMYNVALHERGHPVQILHTGRGGSSHVRCQRCKQEFWMPGQDFVDRNGHLGMTKDELMPMDRSWADYSGCGPDCKRRLPPEVRGRGEPCRVVGEWKLW
jgi:hypothetical protein